MMEYFIQKYQLHEGIVAEQVEYFLFRRNTHYKRPWALTDEIQDFLSDKDFCFLVDPMLESDIRSVGVKLTNISYILTLDQIISIQKPRLEFSNSDDLVMFRLMFE